MSVFSFRYCWLVSGDIAASCELSDSVCILSLSNLLQATHLAGVRWVYAHQLHKLDVEVLGTMFASALAEASEVLKGTPVPPRPPPPLAPDQSFLFIIRPFLVGVPHPGREAFSLKSSLAQGL